MKIIVDCKSPWWGYLWSLKKGYLQLCTSWRVVCLHPLTSDRSTDIQGLYLMETKKLPQALHYAPFYQQKWPFRWKIIEMKNWQQLSLQSILHWDHNHDDAGNYVTTWRNVWRHIIMPCLWFDAIAPEGDQLVSYVQGQAVRTTFSELFNVVSVKWSCLKEANFCAEMPQFVVRNSVWNIGLNDHSEDIVLQDFHFVCDVASPMLRATNQHKKWNFRNFKR